MNSAWGSRQVGEVLRQWAQWQLGVGHAPINALPICRLGDQSVCIINQSAANADCARLAPVARASLSQQVRASPLHTHSLTCLFAVVRVVAGPVDCDSTTIIFVLVCQLLYVTPDKPLSDEVNCKTRVAFSPSQPPRSSVDR